jgi:hypothetical protein
MSVGVGFALTLALSAIPMVAISDAGQCGKPVACRIDGDCSGYYRCNPERVCAVPPAVVGHSDARTPGLELVAGTVRARGIRIGDSTRLGNAPRRYLLLDG